MPFDPCQPSPAHLPMDGADGECSPQMAHLFSRGKAKTVSLRSKLPEGRTGQCRDTRGMRERRVFNSSILPRRTREARFGDLSVNHGEKGRELRKVLGSPPPSSSSLILEMIPAFPNRLFPACILFSPRLRANFREELESQEARFGKSYS